MFPEERMRGRRVRWWIAAAMVACAATTVAQPGPPSAARGELLYKTHCGSCHTTQVHWRDRKLAADWKGLQAQVRRWQRNTGLKWSDQEIADVTRYLNGQFYHFAPPARQAGEPAPRLAASAGR
jgi:mono/diheme cytochrome c family protein